MFNIHLECVFLQKDGRQVLIELYPLLEAGEWKAEECMVKSGRRNARRKAGR